MIKYITTINLTCRVEWRVNIGSKDLQVERERWYLEEMESSADNVECNCFMNLQMNQRDSYFVTLVWSDLYCETPISKTQYYSSSMIDDVSTSLEPSKNQNQETNKCKNCRGLNDDRIFPIISILLENKFPFLLW